VPPKLHSPQWALAGAKLYLWGGGNTEITLGQLYVFDTGQPNLLLLSSSFFS